MAASQSSTPVSAKNNNTCESTSERFQSAIDEFSRELLFLATNYKGHNISPEVIRFGRSYLMLLPKESLIESFLQSSHMYWDNIRTQDDTFFVNHLNALFSGIPSECIDGIRTLLIGKDSLGQPIIPVDKKQSCWEYVKYLVKQSIRYAHAKRKLDATCFPFLPAELTSEAQKWSITLK